MDYKERALRRIAPLLEQHPYISIEFAENSFRTVMGNRNPNILGNFSGGDMAYIANASAGLACVIDGVIAQTASINVECVSRGDGEYLVSDAVLVSKGSKLIRLRCDVYVRLNNEEKLVAIAQLNMSPMTDAGLAIRILQ